MKKHRLMMFENKILKIILGSKTEEVTENRCGCGGSWRWSCCVRGDRVLVVVVDGVVFVVVVVVMVVICSWWW
jgi:hypothetical protein